MTSSRSRFEAPIATRELVRTDTGATVVVQLGCPRRRRTGECECPYRVQGLGKVKTGRAFGEDSMQALQLAFEAVRLELEPHAAILTWYGQPGETGFPQYVPWVFGVPFRTRLEAIINREVERKCAAPGTASEDARPAIRRRCRPCMIGAEAEAGRWAEQHDIFRQGSAPRLSCSR